MSLQFFDIKLVDQQRKFECSSNDQILDAGLRHGLSMRYECSNGSCGACSARLVEGDIEKTKHHDFLLSAEQKENNEFLMCSNSPRSNITIEVDLINSVKSIATQWIDTKVKKIQFLDSDIAVVTLRTPRSKTLQFMAGQDVLLSFDDRYFSRYPIASCPCHGMELEFHVRKVATDEFAMAIFEQSIKSKSVISLEGPKGVFVLKESSKLPMVFIAWNNGFAPIRSLIEHAFSLEMPNSIHFYWAYSSDQQQPYLNNHALSWNAVMDDYHYLPIQSDSSDAKKVAELIYNRLDLDIVHQSDVYLSAPPEVIIALGEMLLENGLGETQLIASPVG